MRISDLLRSKGDTVITVPPETDVAHLVALLMEHRIGAVVVSSDGETVQGIVSERDVVVALASRGPGALTESVTAIFTADVHTATPETQVDELMRLMTDRRVRHVPVLVDGKLHGIVSIGDIVKRRIDELESERAALNDYIATAR
jgi:CBS domain-containing protein